MNLLLFDVDGTLVDSSHDDDRLFREALRDALPPEVTAREPGAWETFPEVTHPAIVRTLVRQARGRAATEGEIEAVRRTFTAKWQHALASGAVKLRPCAGAIEILQQASTREGYAIAIATGGWAQPALLKLHAAGISADRIVIVTADDAEERATLLRTAAIYAAAARGAPGFSHKILVGDAVWDARAARAVRAGFIGINPDPAAAARLRAEGATVVLPHFEPPEHFWTAVQSALGVRSSSPGN